MALEHTVISILIWFGLYLIIAISLNLEYGYGGIPNFGRALAALMGAIAVGAVVNRILILMFGITGSITTASGIAKSTINEIIAQNPAVGIGLLLFTLLISGILGIVVGALFILPSAKLESDYLAITLLAISEVAYMVCYYNTDIMGGYYGVPTPNVLAFIPGEWKDLVFMCLILLVALVVYFFAERLLNTPYGRLLRATRENENVVRAFGKDVMKIRIKTVAVGSGIASMSGALYSFYTGNVSGIVNLFSRVEWTFFPFLMVLLGGLGNNRGVAVGVLTFVTIRKLLEVYKHEITRFFALPFDVNWLQYILFGVMMLLILYYRPDGLIKEKPIMTEPIKKLAEKKGQK
ncbi:branched-chain amino acid ABC transporter permease [Archaeoglobus veneficus]|uniref:ABC-type transporter, integral membrane subunit n=1 Tax=Archaeoglobus veneficus (strain DSM 11195 / SNP6) TaxID=693661 RepID=F2KRZ0_ARCVS|nr:branched-chain amino acid ABC transporter permease [Archaeoglobus veneficus]AEA46831.1 ABC-type transporter, integral membrane subunit [Archaeoglobus veneficus SNP6]